MPALAVQEETAFAREYECPEGKHRDESAKESKRSTKRSSYRKRRDGETIPGRMAAKCLRNLAGRVTQLYPGIET